MKFPEIPNHRTVTREEALMELLNSIAYEESAISRLFTSESKRIDAFIGKSQELSGLPTHREILEFCQSLNQILSSIHMKEWVLYKKLELILNSSKKEHHDNKTLL